MFEKKKKIFRWPRKWKAICKQYIEQNKLRNFFKITAKLRRFVLMMAAFGIFMSCNVIGLFRCFWGTNHMYYIGQNPKKMTFTWTTPSLKLIAIFPVSFSSR
jgi:hypothetical protein